MRKLRGLYFLPGGAGKYVSSLLECLAFIKNRKTDMIVLKRWFFDNFPQTRREKTVENYIKMITNQLGLIRVDQGRFVLTVEGERFLSTRDNAFLFQVLNQRVAGISELLRLVETPKPFSEIDSAFRVRFGWKTSRQVRIRLSWLQSMGFIVQTRNIYGLTEAGSKLVSETEIKEESIPPVEKPHALEAEVTTTPHHNEIRDMIGEIGRFEGWISEVEYTIDKMRLDVIWKRIEVGNPSYTFEVQVAGNFYEALTKLKHAWDKWNSKLFLVTTEKYEIEAKQLLKGAFHEIEHVIRIVNWKKIRDLHEVERKAQVLKTDIGFG